MADKILKKFKFFITVFRVADLSSPNCRSQKIGIVSKFCPLHTNFLQKNCSFGFKIFRAVLDSLFGIFQI